MQLESRSKMWSCMSGIDVKAGWVYVISWYLENVVSCPWTDPGALLDHDCVSVRRHEGHCHCLRSQKVGKSTDMTYWKRSRSVELGYELWYSDDVKDNVCQWEWQDVVYEMKGFWTEWKHIVGLVVDISGKYFSWIDYFRSCGFGRACEHSVISNVWEQLRSLCLKKQKSDHEIDR